MNSKIDVIVNGQRLKGWKTINLEKSMDALAGMFTLGSADKAEFSADSWVARIGQTVRIEANGTALLDGYLDSFDIGYDDQGHTVSISGRDKLCDLIDCNWAEPTKNWSGVTILSVINTLVKPFGLVAEPDNAKVTELLNHKPPTIAVNDSESVFDAIYRLCSKRGVRPICYGDGKLVLTSTESTSAAGTSLVRGKNILLCMLTQSNRDRYSIYHAKGQSKGGAGDVLAMINSTGGNSAACKAEDSTIKRYRPMVVINEGNTDPDSSLKRAKLEAAIRAGKSRQWNYRVHGWLQTEGGAPWRINQLVHVDDPTVNIKSALLICGVKYSHDKNGTFADLTLCFPDKYKLDADLSAMTTEFDDSGEGGGISLSALGLTPQ